MPDGTKHWFNEEGKLHRFDGPAVEWADGNREWYIDGKPHRSDGPAIEYASGRREWWVDDKLHRLDGPAIERPDGSKEWWFNGRRHRLDGPAIEWASGDKAWWVDDTLLSQEQFDRHPLVVFYRLAKKKKKDKSNANVCPGQELSEN
jgi:hypothetical protein